MAGLLRSGSSISRARIWVASMRLPRTASAGAAQTRTASTIAGRIHLTDLIMYIVFSIPIHYTKKIPNPKRPDKLHENFNKDLAFSEKTGL
jgi:hypothetical protein